MDRIKFTAPYEEIVSVDNLLDAWKEFILGKRKRKDVQEFERHLMRNILVLHRELIERTYAHGSYDAFKINDPKPRDIHKAVVRDRLIHHALYRRLYPFFDRTFIADSYSCRLGKGTHKAMEHFRAFAREVSQNDTRTCWVLKCDIRKFFASINHAVLVGILRERIPDHRVLRTATKRRMFQNLAGNAKPARAASYLGMLSHGNAHLLAEKVMEIASQRPLRVRF